MLYNVAIINIVENHRNNCQKEIILRFEGWWSEPVYFGSLYETVAQNRTRKSYGTILCLSEKPSRVLPCVLRPAGGESVPQLWHLKCSSSTRTM